MAAFRRFLVLLLFAGLVFAPLPSVAANAKTGLPAPVIVLIDMQRILEESLAAKSAQKQLEQQRSKFQNQTEAEENELRQAEQDLSKSRDHVTADVYAAREQELRQKFLAVERHVQARRKVLDQGFSDSMNAVKASLLEIVQSVAHERGANMVLTKQEAIWVDKGFDVTDEVLSRLNKKLPQVTVKLTPEESK